VGKVIRSEGNNVTSPSDQNENPKQSSDVRAKINLAHKDGSTLISWD
jgi:hypothetical protein